MKKDLLVLRGIEAEFPRLIAFAEEFACRCGLPDDERSRILIILEELFTNVVHYGYPDGATGSHIEVAMAAKPGWIEIDFCDDGIPFDPLARDLSGCERAPGDQTEGGQGLEIIRSLAHRADYRRDGNCNRLALVRKFGG